MTQPMAGKTARDLFTGGHAGRKKTRLIYLQFALIFLKEIRTCNRPFRADPTVQAAGFDAS